MTATLSVPFRAGLDDLPSRIVGHAARRPSAPAVVCAGRTATWSDLAEGMRRVAGGLLARGLRPGDRVGILASASVTYLEVLTGVLAARGCVVPLPTLASGEALRLMTADAGPSALFVSAAHAELGASLAPTTTIVALDFDDPRFVAYGRIRAAAPAPALPAQGHDDLDVIYSSGTTGAPRGIVHTHAARHATVRAYETYGFAADTCTLLSTPLYSNTTLVAWLPTVYHGGTQVLMPRFDADEAVALTASLGVTHAMWVPSQLQRLLPALGRRGDLSSLRYSFCTSAPFPVPLKRAVLDALPGELVEIYGMSEGGPATFLHTKQYPDRLASVGRARPGTIIKIIDDDGQELPAGERGEIVGRNASMMRGYLGREEETRRLEWRDGEGALFYRSGDVGWLDPDGFLHVVDRKKDVILSGGFNVYACDLEAVLARHPGVAEVAVVGVPSEAWGETPVAVVVPGPGAPAEEALRAWANERLGKTQRLAGVAYRPELPRNALGKVLKRELRAAFAGSPR